LGAEPSVASLREPVTKVEISGRAFSQLE